MIDGKKIFHEPIKDNKITHKHIRKIATGQGDDYTTGCLLDYIYYIYFIFTFPHKLLLANRQVENLRKVFANESSTDIKLSKTPLSKMVQSRGFLGRLLGLLLKNEYTKKS